ncbi:MAG: hypothetical protein IJZ29_05100 [Clostridia bacterium]|nr:hypothetical protein [Clostridia bacterium]
MKEYIGYPLEKVLTELKGKDIEIIYNTQKKEDDKLYVTNVDQKNNKTYITVSHFKIEV